MIIELNDISYGEHERQILDISYDDALADQPWVCYFHSGGFNSGDKSSIEDELRQGFLDAGIAVISANYRFIDDTPLVELITDVSKVMRHCESADWNLSADRIGLIGASAGAGLTLCTGLGPEAGKVKVMASFDGQFSYDFCQWEEWIGPLPPGNTSEAHLIYHLKDEATTFLDEHQEMRDKLDMRGLIRSDSCPLLLWTRCPYEKWDKDMTVYLHTPRHQEILADRYKELGLDYELYIEHADPPFMGNINEKTVAFIQRYI
ncbi:MAG: alpha/beta hydrolase fold domain-containing protein [Lentisphaeria bacterium]|nr:alpha/beta hydrolase [Lentisphaeria bacterium]NQZ69804.1 alpha/beta hydrolase fold domain-containing protein [Lentisphaeria bacterium]